MIPLQSRHTQIKANHQNSEDKILTQTKDTDNRFLSIIINKRITNFHWIINLLISFKLLIRGTLFFKFLYRVKLDRKLDNVFRHSTQLKGGTIQGRLYCEFHQKDK